LKNKILKRQVYLKYDELKYDENECLMAYVYMKNKTFINAHLLKHGFAKVDTEYPFKDQTRFEKLSQEKVISENKN